MQYSVSFQLSTVPYYGHNSTHLLYLYRICIDCSIVLQPEVKARVRGCFQQVLVIYLQCMGTVRFLGDREVNEL